MASDLTIETAPLPADGTDTLVIYAGEGAPPTGAGADIWAKTGLDWARASEAGAFKGKQGQVLDLICPAGLDVRRLLVLGAGKPAKSGAAIHGAWADRGGSLGGKLIGMRIGHAAVVVDAPDATPEAIADLAAGIRLRHYRFDKYKSPKKDDEDRPSLKVTLHVADPSAADRAIAERMATVEGTLLARDLIHEPPNVLGPAEFAAEAGKLAALGVEVEVLEVADMQALGMNALLAVGQGSVRPAKLVVMQWKGGEAGAQPVAFVGKGVVFDTGGISIKPAANMEDMKGDMSGAAAVTGLMRTLALRKAKVNAVGILGLVENMPDGNAMRPGDIVRTASGVTVEIVNTDAEGRLVLSDALWYAQDRFKPKFVINLATLTGAVVVALGQDHAGLFSNDDDLSNKLLGAGLESGEKLWRLPLTANYDKLIESRFADIKNSAGRPASSISAAQFLQRFIKDTPWAHLDIAGTAMGVNANETNTSWAPGFGVALLDRLVRNSFEN